MRRALLLASSLLLLIGVLGTAAYAGCDACLERIVAERSGAGVSFTITARAADESFVFPDAGTAVVMRIDGNRTKCITIGLQKRSELPGLAVYTGTFTGYGGNGATQSGRVDIGGQIYDFAVPLDGRAGTLAVSADQSPLARRLTTVVVTAAATPAPTAGPASGGEAGAFQVPAVAREPAFLLGAMVVLVTLVGAYVDRRRALARTLAR